jgi:co-chaperonin GroES (HSP10)
MYEIDLKSAIETNVIVLGALTMEASGNRILVLEDEFRSGMECPACVGKRKIKSPELEELVCENCEGSGRSMISKEARCSRCKGTGRTICEKCKGKGGVLIVAEQSERRPTTGQILSIGSEIFCTLCDGAGGSSGQVGDGIVNSKDCPRCKGTGGTQTFQRGQSVIYTSFSGHCWDLELPNGEQIVIRVIQESDILAKVSGHLELRRVKKTQALGSAA